MRIRYSIWDPSGNITALVESPVPDGRQIAVAAELMARHPAVEQLGFVSWRAEDGTDAALRMAGGEFCGNASMSAAALLQSRMESTVPSGAWITRSLRVSGARQPVAVRLQGEKEDVYRGAVCMPKARAIVETAFRWGSLSGRLPLVRMEGIAHLIVSDASSLFALKDRPAEAEEAVKTWCAALDAEGLGLMFLEHGEGDPRLTPLVYIPGSATVFWESSCASGSSAVGMALAAGSGRAQRLTLAQPGGRLQVESDPKSGETWLYGRTALLGQYDTEIRG